jgi:hypothetical protein
VKGEIYTPDESGTAMSEAERTARLLTRAADRLDGLAGAATRGPWVEFQTPRLPSPDDSQWTITRPWCGRGGLDGDCDDDCGATVVSTGREECEEDYLGAADAHWVAAMSPAVAAPLVAWLRSWVPVAPRLVPGTPWLDANLDAAVEFARLVLGEPLEAVGPESAGDGSAGSASVRPLEAPVAVQRPENDHG